MADMTEKRITEIVNANFETEEAFIAFLKMGALSLAVSASGVAKKLLDAQTAEFQQAQEAKKAELTAKENADAAKLAELIAAEA